MAANGSAGYYDYNITGNTVGITGTTGTLVNVYAYLPFGQTITLSASVSNAFTFVGQSGVMSIADGLLLTMQRRDYDPASGQFLSIDPIGLGGGTNDRAYAGGNPISDIDPSGFDDNYFHYVYNNTPDGACYSPQQLTNPNYSATRYPNGSNTDPNGLDCRHFEAAYNSVKYLMDHGCSYDVAYQITMFMGGGIEDLEWTNNGFQALPDTAQDWNSNKAGAFAAYLDSFVDEPFPSPCACGCPPDNPPTPPPGGQGPTGGPGINVPTDPNSIIGPGGFGAENFVSIDQVLPYQIDFENDGTGPAQEVTITEQLDAGLNWQSFRLGSFGFGGTTYTVPANTAFYQTQIDMTATNGYYVDVAATIDERTGIATWTFTTIDPATGGIPADPSIGFLPPDNANGIGEGFVSYTVMANASDATGTVISAQATVDFYTQPPLNTPSISNTIDAGVGLTSSVAALPAYQNATQFNLFWAGTDATNGSAISSYTIYVSDDGGPFTLWLTGTILTSAPYTGQQGHTYGFYSIATNNAGNSEKAMPSAAQASTTIVLPTAITSTDAVTFISGKASNFTFTTTGVPTAAFTESGLFPAGITLHDNGNGTASLSGTPGRGQRHVCGECHGQ